MKQHILQDHLFRFQWVGVVFNVVSVFMVGSTAILSETEKETEEVTDDSAGNGSALLGVLFVMLGALVQAMVSGGMVLLHRFMGERDPVADSLSSSVIIYRSCVASTAICL
jgi:drug/metabolite transporter (DMT)-like permease